MMRRSFALLSTASAIAILLLLIFLGGVARADTWEQIAEGGIKGDYNKIQNEVDSSAFFNGKLYIGTYSGYTGCQIWRYDGGTSWTKVNANGFGKDQNWSAASMCVFGSYLYVGTVNSATGCEAWRTADGTTWNPVVGSGASTAGGFGESTTTCATSMCVFNSNLYVGTYNDNSFPPPDPGCRMWRTSDGTTWTQVVGQGSSGPTANGFGDTSNWQVSSMAVLGSTVYVSNTKIVAKVPSGISGTVTVKVTTSGGTSAGKSFTVKK